MFGAILLLIIGRENIYSKWCKNINYMCNYENKF
jgi:hypothetical protein